MNLKPKSLPRAVKRYTITAVLAVVGLLLAWYGFELVSVPHIREYRELLYIALGVVILIAGGGYGVMGGRGLKQAKSGASEGA
ncbi:MAG: hypothetical protein WBG37_16440 [Desulfobacterales bacterium]